jgi:hypothetical protein
MSDGKADWTPPALAASAAVAGFLMVQPVTTITQTASAPQAAFASIAASSPTPAQSQRLAGYLVAHSQFSSPMGRRSVWSGVLAADPGLQRVSYEVQEAP